MLSNLVSFFKGVEVRTEPDGTIRILGMKTGQFLAEIDKYWKTSRVSGHLFRNVRSQQLDIYPFFAPDFYYICKKLLGERRTRINRSAVQEVIKQLETNTWLKDAVTPEFTSKLNLAALDRFTVTPMTHQNVFLRTYDEMTQKWRLNGYILGAAPGSGKTYSALFLSECLDTDVTICIVPKNAVERVWKSTLEIGFKVKPEFWYSTSGEEPMSGKRYYVAHYEQIGRMAEFFKRPEFKGKRINIILDESHNLNELKAIRTELLIELCAVVNCKDVLWTSGTPFKAMGSEVIPVLRTIDPFFTPKAEERFKKIFGLSSARGLDILAHRLGYMTFKVDKAQVVGNTVERYRIDVTLKNGNDYTLAAISADMSKFIKERTGYYEANKKKYIDWYMQGLRAHERLLRTTQEVREFEEYVRMAKLLHTSYDPFTHKQEPILCNAYEKRCIIPNLPKDLRENFKNSRSVYKYVSLKIQGEALGRVLSKKREQCNVDMLSAKDNYICTDLQTGEKTETSLVEIIENSVKKTVIFTSYVAVVDSLYDSMKAAGGYPLKVYGETNGELPQIIGMFEKDIKTNPLIATLKSLSTAVPLIMANTVVFLNSPFRDYEYDQACSRVDRLGQTEIVFIYDVYLDTGKEPNISTRSLDIMAWSKSQVEQMMGLTLPADLGMESYADEFGDITEALPSPGVAESGQIYSLSASGDNHSW